MTEQIIRDIFHDVPLDGELAGPLVLLPIVHALLEVNGSNHLGDTAELTTRVYLSMLFLR